jgi:phage-related protein
MLTLIVRTIKFYLTPSGNCPIEEFLDSLSDQHAQKITWVLRLIERIDNVPIQYLKKLDGTQDIWEIRAQFGSNNYRLLGFFDSGRLIILTNGFSKKTQKTPAKEIKLAEQRRYEYLQRRKSHE